LNSLPTTKRRASSALISPAIAGTAANRPTVNASARHIPVTPTDATDYKTQAGSESLPDYATPFVAKS